VTRQKLKEKAAKKKKKAEKDNDAQKIQK